MTKFSDLDVQCHYDIFLRASECRNEFAPRTQALGSIHLAATQANSKADALSLLNAARAELNLIETFYCLLSPVFGTDARPGTVTLN